METALTLPLTLFLVLGTIQLFLLFQARVMAQYAAARATRAGSLHHGACNPMIHTAVTAVLPTFTPTRTPAELATAFLDHRDGNYVPVQNAGHNEAIVWLIRDEPTNVVNDDEESFDLASGNPRTLIVRLVFWYPMRIPFANWVVSAITRAHFGLKNLAGVNPLMVTQSRPNWLGNGVLDSAVAAELTARSNLQHYVMPIQVSASMRMMTPPRVAHFPSPRCELTP